MAITTRVKLDSDQVFHVQVEPPLQNFSGEQLKPSTANTNDEARSDISARGFWMNQQNAFFDVSVLYPHASSYSSRSLASLYQSFEHENKAKYADRILQVEHGTFTPLIFSSCGYCSEKDRNFDSRETKRELPPFHNSSSHTNFFYSRTSRIRMLKRKQISTTKPTL